MTGYELALRITRAACAICRFNPSTGEFTPRAWPTEGNLRAQMPLLLIEYEEAKALRWFLEVARSIEQKLRVPHSRLTLDIAATMDAFDRASWGAC